MTPPEKKEKVAVFGGGTWGATLAHHLANKGHQVSIWEYNSNVAKTLEANRTLSTLPDFKLHPSVKVSDQIKNAAEGMEIILSVTPSHTVRETFRAAVQNKALKKGTLVISASKGIENKTCAPMSQVIREMFPEAGDIVILSGPSHAEEVSQKQPVALVSACTSNESAVRVQKLFSSDTFRIYTGNDPVGVELGGSLKNVYAVACGIIDGLKLGDNTKAALMTRGLLEMTRLGAAMGTQTLTFFGLSGLGDLIVTCGSQHSRNRLVGEKIGGGKTLEQALAEMTMVAEGVNTTRSAYDLARLKKVDVPIINEMYRVLFENKSPQDSIKDLLARQVGAEMEGIVL